MIFEHTQDMHDVHFVVRDPIMIFNIFFLPLFFAVIFDGNHDRRTTSVYDVCFTSKFCSSLTCGKTNEGKFEEVDTFLTLKYSINSKKQITKLPRLKTELFHISFIKFQKSCIRSVVKQKHCCFSFGMTCHKMENYMKYLLSLQTFLDA